MNWQWYLAQLLARSVEVLPWLLGGLAWLAVVSFSPLGRNLVRYLRTRQDEKAINEQMLGELEDLRKVLGEISERLDVTERRWTQEQLALPRPPAGMEQLPPAAAEKVVTPH
jgi:hypothetical protein